MANKTEQLETINSNTGATVKSDLRAGRGRRSAPERRDTSDEDDTEQTTATVTNHQLWPEMMPYENVDGKFIFTFDRPTTWHVTTVINDTSVVTVELSPSIERSSAHSHVLRIRQTLQPIESKRLERYQHDTQRNQPRGRAIDPLSFGGQAVAIHVNIREKSHQWTIILPDDSGLYPVQLTTEHTNYDTNEISDDHSNPIEKVRKLGLQVLYSFRPKDAETVVQ